MSDKRLVAIHRGGLLTKEDHRKIIRWARGCSEHVLPLMDEKIDQRLVRALHVARKWENEKATTGAAMRASLHAHAAARELSNPLSTAVAHSIGQAVATAHRADNSLLAALCALKAVGHAGGSIDSERRWQSQRLRVLPSEIMELVITKMLRKQKFFAMESDCGGLDLPRFRGRRIIWEKGVHDAKNATSVSIGISPTGDRIGEGRTHAIGIGLRVRTKGTDYTEFG